MNQNNLTSKESKRDFILLRVIIVLGIIYFSFGIIKNYNSFLKGNNILYFYSITSLFIFFSIAINFRNVHKNFILIIKLSTWIFLVCLTFYILSKPEYSYITIEGITLRREWENFLEFLFYRFIIENPLMLIYILIFILSVPYILLTAIEFSINTIFGILRRYKIIKS